MDIRPLTPAYAVSPQITPDDLPAIKAAGYVAIINNRPDSEIPMELSADVMAIAAEAAGLGYTVNPVTHQTLNMDMVAAQMQAAGAAGGPVLAYCASGTRSSIVWALGQAGQMGTADIIATAGKAGYDLSGLAPRLDALTRG
jgi:uncharacterized protein (TIGR01244 family)